MEMDCLHLHNITNIDLNRLILNFDFVFWIDLQSQKYKSCNHNRMDEIV